MDILTLEGTEIYTNSFRAARSKLIYRTELKMRKRQPQK